MIQYEMFDMALSALNVLAMFALHNLYTIACDFSLSQTHASIPLLMLALLISVL